MRLCRVLALGAVAVFATVAVARPLGPAIEPSSVVPDDLDVTEVPAPKPKPKPRKTASTPTASPATENRPVSGDDGEKFQFRVGLSVASYQYNEVAAAPLVMSNAYLNGSLEVSRRVFSVWILAMSVDSPVLKISTANPANFGPLAGRFSVGRYWRFSDQWDGSFYLSWLFLTAVGTRNRFGPADISGGEAKFRARFRNQLEFEFSAALLGSRQAGIVTGDRYLGFQCSYWVRPWFAPFVSVDETKAQFADKRIAAGRFRTGILAEF